MAFSWEKKKKKKVEKQKTKGKQKTLYDVRKIAMCICDKCGVKHVKKKA